MATEESQNPEIVRELFFIAVKTFVHNFGADVFDLEYISIRENRSVIISKKNHAYYPLDFVSEFQESNQGLENAQEYCELNVTLKPLKIVISVETFKASLQLHERELKSIPNSFFFNVNGNVWQLSEDLLGMLEKVREVDDGNYQICCGFTKDELGSKAQSPYLICLKYPYTKYMSIKCDGVFQRCIKNHNDLSSSIPRCKNCKMWLKASRKHVRRTAEKELEEGPVKLLKTDCHSSCAISKLSPKNRKKRISNLRVERKNLTRNIKSLKKKCDMLMQKLNVKRFDELKDMVDLIPTELPDKLNVVNAALEIKQEPL